MEKEIYRLQDVFQQTMILSHSEIQKVKKDSLDRVKSFLQIHLNEINRVQPLITQLVVTASDDVHVDTWHLDNPDDYVYEIVKGSGSNVPQKVPYGSIMIEYPEYDREIPIRDLNDSEPYYHEFIKDSDLRLLVQELAVAMDELFTSDLGESVTPFTLEVK